MTLPIANSRAPLVNELGQLTGDALKIILQACTASPQQVTAGHVAVWTNRSTLEDGGVPATGGTVTHTGALTNHALLKGNGAADLSALGSLGTTTTVLHGNAAGDPTFGAVSLTADVSGDLPFSSLVQASAASKLVGRGSAAGAGDFQEIILGTNLSLSGTTLNAAGSGTVTTTGSPASGNLTKFSGATSVTNADLTGDVTTAGGVATTLAVSGVTAATYGDATHIPQLAVDAKGRITSASNIALGAGSGTSAIGITIDGAGAVITTGTKGFVYAPRACTITAVTVLSTDAAVLTGSIVVDIWKAAYASYPPTVANTITASAKPTISSAIKSQDTTLTGWTTNISAGDVLGFHVDSVATVTRVTLQLTVTY